MNHWGELTGEGGRPEDTPLAQLERQERLGTLTGGIEDLPPPIALGPQEEPLTRTLLRMRGEQD